MKSRTGRVHCICMLYFFKIFLRSIRLLLWTETGTLQFSKLYMIITVIFICYKNKKNLREAKFNVHTPMYGEGGVLFFVYPSLSGSLHHGTIMGKEDFFPFCWSPCSPLQLTHQYWLPSFYLSLGVSFLCMLCQTLPGGGGEPKQKKQKMSCFLLFFCVLKVFVSDKCTLPRDFDTFKHERGGLVSV